MKVKPYSTAWTAVMAIICSAGILILPCKAVENTPIVLTRHDTVEETASTTMMSDTNPKDHLRGAGDETKKILVSDLLLSPEHEHEHEQEHVVHHVPDVYSHSSRSFFFSGGFLPKKKKSDVTSNADRKMKETPPNHTFDSTSSTPQITPAGNKSTRYTPQGHAALDADQKAVLASTSTSTFNYLDEDKDSREDEKNRLRGNAHDVGEGRTPSLVGSFPRVVNNHADQTKEADFSVSSINVSKDLAGALSQINAIGHEKDVKTLISDDTAKNAGHNSDIAHHSHGATYVQNHSNTTRNLDDLPLVDVVGDPSVPLGLCEGDCDNHDECAGDLMCYQRDEYDPVPGCSGTGNYQWDYCTKPYLQDVAGNPSNPLGLCEGDCDNSDECAGDLMCYQRDAIEPVPGCSGTGREKWDYCAKPFLDDVAGNPSTPLGLCEGDCDNHDECAGDLMCFQRDAVETVPGCSGTGREKWDYCAKPFLDDVAGNPSTPLGLCQGDCDNDSQCAGDLICFQRFAEPVPGCHGTGREKWDYCIHPSALHPSSEPTQEPSFSNITLEPTQAPSFSNIPSTSPHPTPHIGTNYFDSMGTSFEPQSPNNPLFGSSVSISEDGNTLAIGSNKFVQVREKPVGGSRFNYNITTDIPFDRITTESVDVVDVSLSGDGSHLAIAGINSIASGVMIYNQISVGNWEPIGTVIEAGSLGDYKGLEVSLSHDGSLLAIGARNFDVFDEEDLGRVMFYKRNDSNGQYLRVYFLAGTSKGESLGSSVSVTPEGDYVAVGLTGYDGANVNAGAVRVLHVDNESMIGDLIEGEGEDDAFGFSIKLVKIGTDTLQVAAGAIYNDPISGMTNAGHVRVFQHNGNGDWVQRGTDIDGDIGASIDFEKGEFHIGDSFGFAMGMSTNGERVAVSAPFYGKSRMGEYYQGSVKLLEFDAVKNDWVQIANSILGITGEDNIGYSIDLSGDGRMILIGSPGWEKQGKALVYYQDEMSNAPSNVPTTSVSPSEATSLQPTLLSAPTATPSISSMPSVHPSESSIPSLGPSVSFAPSAKPSISPEPSMKPSVSSSPSSEPSVSSEPSLHPSVSTIPSMKPSKSLAPSLNPSISLEPSVHPSISSAPSMRPTSSSDRTFQIVSTYEKYESLPGKNRWCLEARNAGPGSLLFVKPCNNTDARQRWYFDKENNRIVMKEYEELCIFNEFKKLRIAGCNTVMNPFYIDEDNGTIYATKNGKKFYFGVNHIRIFSRVRLFKEGFQNSSWDTWMIMYESSQSLAPSLVPSHQD